MLVVLTLLQALSSDSLATERVAGPLAARLDAQLSHYADSGFWGTVLIVRDRRILLLKGYGWADSIRHIRNTAATRFEMNSMTKMFTGVAILQLAAAGRLRLDDPVERHFPGFSTEKRDATIAQLASHTSGLIVAGSNLAGESRAAFVRDLQRTPREAPAGTQYRYTNAGYSPCLPPSSRSRLGKVTRRTCARMPSSRPGCAVRASATRIPSHRTTRSSRMGTAARPILMCGARAARAAHG